MINQFLGTFRKVNAKQRGMPSDQTRATIIWGRKIFNLHVVPLFQLDVSGNHHQTRKGPLSCFRPEQLNPHCYWLKDAFFEVSQAGTYH